MGYTTLTCPYEKKCGGCEWLSVPYPIQLKRKRKMLVELFGDLLNDKQKSCLNILGMNIDGVQVPVAYRHKAATPFAPGKHQHIQSGFYVRGTHTITPCDACLVEDPRARHILHAVAKAAEEAGIHAYHEDKGRGILRNALVRLDRAGKQALLILVTNGYTLPHKKEFIARILELAPCVTSVVQNINQRQTNAILGEKSQTLYGKGYIVDSILGCDFEVGATTFFQTNPQQTDVLYKQAFKAAGLGKARKPLQVLDAYCGCGTIGICAAARFPNMHVLGIERTPEAVARAKRNVNYNHLKSECDFVCDDATNFMKKHQDLYFDVAFLDPPRAGATESFLRNLAQCTPERVVYISCNPQTQVRDIYILLQHGYHLESLVGVDMFPHTKHLETVVCLRK